MTAKTLTEATTETQEGMRLYQQERAILEITELICQLMKEQEMTRSNLAERLGKTKGYVTQLLDGNTNMTVRTIADVFTVLGRCIHFQEGPLSASGIPIRLRTRNTGEAGRDRKSTPPGVRRTTAP